MYSCRFCFMYAKVTLSILIAPFCLIYCKSSIAVNACPQIEKCVAIFPIVTPTTFPCAMLISASLLNSLSRSCYNS